MVQEVFEVKAEKVFFKDSEGKKLAFLLVTSDKPIATVILCPGLAEVKEDLQYDAEYFTKQGFKALVIDYYGYGKSGGKLEEFTLTNCIKTLRAAIDFIGGPVFVFGESWGGKVMIHAAAVDERIKAIHLLSPCSYPEFEASVDAKKIIKHGPEKYDAAPHHTVTREFAMDFLAYDTDKDVKKIKCPIFITHGDVDKSVLLEGTKKLYSALTVEKGLHVFKGVGHNLEMTNEAYAESLRIAAYWFKKHLGV